MNKYMPINKPAEIRTALMGGEIQSVQVRGDGSAYLVVTRGDRTFTLATQSDPEGNGPGFLAVDEVIR